MEPAGQPTTHEKAPEPAGSPAAQPRRFVYAGGDRPLAGYTIKRGVGHGGFGEIYFATSDAGKEVALKLIRRNLDVELRGTSQCLNLKHPNLLAVYDIRQDSQGDTWVVMEYAAQRSLEEVLAQRPNGLGPEEAMGWLRGIGAAVAYLHDHGIVHRDLKPGNIFCDEGIVKVGDYGLAKFISQTRRTGHTESVGTVHYMAPEVAKGRYGKELDIYALGVMLYEMLTGRVPFEGESVAEVLMKHLTAKPDLSPLAEPYRSVVGRALEKDPDDRFRSVEEMMAALPRSPHDALYLNSREATPPGESVNPTNLEPPDANSGRRCLPADGPSAEWPRKGSFRSLVLPGIILSLLMFAVLARTGEGLEITEVVTRVAFVVGLGWLSVYLAYRLFRSIMSSTTPSSSARPPLAASPPGAQPALPATPRSHWRRPHETPVVAMIVKSPREWLTELIGSLLLSALAAAAACFVIVVLDTYFADWARAPRPEQCAWLLLVSIAGSWAVLVPSKFWEGFCGDPWPRRFLLMTLGLGVGVIAFLLADLLMIRLTPGAELPVPLHYRPPPAFYAPDGRPLLLGYMASFGTLFLVIRFWRLADPLRRRRVRIWLVLLHALVGALVTALWQFPEPWLPMAAASISASVQLSSPWVPRRKR